MFLWRPRRTSPSLSTTSSSSTSTNPSLSSGGPESPPPAPPRPTSEPPVDFRQLDERLTLPPPPSTLLPLPSLSRPPPPLPPRPLSPPPPDPSLPPSPEPEMAKPAPAVPTLRLDLAVLPFDGHKKNFRTFLRSLRMRYHANQEVYVTDEAKVLFALSKITGEGFAT